VPSGTPDSATSCTTEGWDTVAVIADDYSFGHTSTAGFIADFCGRGEVTTRVFPPLGTTDYSSYIAQLPDPDEVDGYFWVVGGTGTQAALEAFVNAKGDLTGDQHAGNLFFNPDLAQALGPDIAGAYVGGFATPPGDVQTPEIEEYLASADATWDSLPTGIAGGEPAMPQRQPASGSCTATTRPGSLSSKACRPPAGPVTRTPPERSRGSHRRPALRADQSRREPQRHRRCLHLAARRRRGDR
jgi:hypothetical protein